MASKNNISVQRILDASPEDSFRIVVEVEDFPDFMTNVTSVQVLSSNGNRKVVAWEMMIDDAPLDWTEEVTYDNSRLRVDFRAIEGVFLRFDGYWQVHRLDGRSRVELRLEYDLGIPEIESVIGPVLKTRLMENLESMLTCIETRAAAS
jgi:ribosome-associated toxin RatA of RatAB toxin-antitoxin module